MKPQELRIGNIIKQGIVTYLEANDTEIIYIRCGGKTIQNPQSEPITEEWLLKFLGFKKHYEGLQIDVPNGCLKISLKFRTAFITNSDEPLYDVLFPEYVHQLQNLYFALTSEELTIKE